ncbi:MAG: alpha/beta fold hydrolase [Candidatus Doudnabacteria bacterium]|nr:alpha/beta fold hydrolase [Candidatus Doudnabacteria bacterium]
MNKIKIISLGALILGALFLSANQTSAALNLPQTPCDDEQVDAILPGFGVSAHITSNMELEKGETAFTYGTDNNSFVTASAGLITFHPNLLFDPASNAGSLVKLYAFNATCAIVFGFGPVSGADRDAPLQAGPNTVSYNTTNNQVVFNNGIIHQIFPNLAPRYVWLEVWDGKTSPDKQATYSYLIDIQNVQNPTGSVDGAEPPGKRPVLIIPGITGTELLNSSDELIWPNIPRMFFDINDQFLTENLSLNGNGDSVQNIKVGEIIREISFIAPEIGINKIILDSFFTLINSMILEGYVIDDSLFFFPYDWRIDLDTTKASLNQKIKQIQGLTGFQKVDIVAHSMGGLLVEDYLDTYGQDKINKLIFVGTPHLGAPKAAKILLYGDHMSIPWLEEDRIQEIAHNSPAVYQLLPNPTYFDNFLGYVAPYHIFKKSLYNYTETQDFLMAKGVNTNLLSMSNQFFDKQLFNQDFGGIEAYNIAGCRTATQSAYRYGIGNNSIGSIGYSSGDGTVPLVSADHVNIPAPNKYYLRNGSHAELPSNPSIRALILGILSDNIQLNNNISNNTSFCNFKGKKLTWRSPVEVHIYDQNGNHAGPIPGGFENNLPGVDYEIIGGEKFIYIPTDDGNTYTIIGLGEEEATIDLIISDIDNGQVTTTTVYNDIPITNLTKIEVVDGQVNYDYEGDGGFNILNADAVLNGDEDKDDEPPVIIVKFNALTQDFEFIASDIVDPDPSIICSETECTAMDQVGNSLTINFWKSLNKNTSILSLIQPVKALFTTNVKYKKGEIRSIKQILTSWGLVAMLDYKENKDSSKVHIQEKGKKAEMETYEGLKFLQLLIKQDMISIEIK